MSIGKPSAADKREERPARSTTSLQTPVFKDVVDGVEGGWGSGGMEAGLTLGCFGDIWIWKGGPLCRDGYGRPSWSQRGPWCSSAGGRLESACGATSCPWRLQSW